MEAQRQRERIKLIEIERKKREQASNGTLSKVSDTNTTTTTTNNQNNVNLKSYATLKRVNIKTPTNKIENVDLLPPLDAKKLKRKPKFKKYLADDNLDTHSQKNPTPSSVSGIILEEHPPSRNHKTKSPAAKEFDHFDTQKVTNHPSTTPHPPVQLDIVKPAEPVKPEIKETEKPKKVTTKKDETISNKLKRQISNASHVTEKYDFIKTLGDGNFAIVKQARHKLTDHEYAIKIIDKSKMKGKENMIENEIYIMKSCNHPNIVKLYEEFETKDEVYLVTDLVKVKNLKQLK